MTQFNLDLINKWPTFGWPLSSTSIAALSVYAVGGFDPKLAFDFISNTYKTGGSDSTIANSVTHSRAGNATMTDSDGKVKWAPHNLLYNSYLTNGWYPTQSTVTANSGIAPNGTTTATLFSSTNSSGSYLMDDGSQFTNIGNYTFKVWAKANTGNSTLRVWLWMLGGSTGQTDTTSFNLTNEWQLLEINPTITASGNARIRIDQPNGVESTFYLWGAHAYRSDLGGMVDNPETGDSYVPTTSSPVYLPRVGHHTYNGDAWVNEGILHESEARTNLHPFSSLPVLGNSGDWNGVEKFWVDTTVVSASVSDIAAPDGSMATKIVTAENGEFGDGYLTTNLSLTGSCVNGQIKSVWARTVSGTGTVGLLSRYLNSWSETALTEEWQRFEVPVDTSGNFEQYFYLVDFRAGDLTEVLIWGAQLETGSTASSYIPTLDASVTRAAETLTVPAANLPWPTPVETTGTELVTNGTFDTDINGWTANSYSALSLSSGSIRVENNANNLGLAYQEVYLEAGKTYYFSADLIAINDLLAQFTLNTDTSYHTTVAGLTNSSTTGTKTFHYTPSSSGTYYIILAHRGGNIAGKYVEFDNISVKEINPLSVSIQMDGKMAYADNGLVREVNFHRWLKDGVNFIQNSLHTHGNNEGIISFNQREVNDPIWEFEVASWSSPAYFTPDINIPFNIASRHGSSFINGAEGGTALTARTDPASLPNLSSIDLELGLQFMGTIGKFRMWDEDLGDVGIATATAPSTEPSLQLTFDGSSTSSFTVLDWSE